MKFVFLFLPLKEKRCIFYIDFWLLVSSRTSNLPSPASYLRRRRVSSSSASIKPMGWFRALPFKPEKINWPRDKRLWTPTPPDTRECRYFLNCNQTRGQENEANTKMLLLQWPSHLLPAHHQLMYCQYSLACSHISVYNAAPEDVMVLCRVQRSGNASVNEAVC